MEDGPPGKGSVAPRRQMHFAAIGFSNDWRACAAELNRSNPIPISMTIAGICNRLSRELDRRVCRRRLEHRRFHSHEVSEGLRFFASGSLDDRETLPVFGNAHEHVAQKSGSRRGRAQIRSRRRSLHGRKLLLHFGRPCGRTRADLEPPLISAWRHRRASRPRGSIRARPPDCPAAPPESSESLAEIPLRCWRPLGVRFLPRGHKRPASSSD